MEQFEKVCKGLKRCCGFTIAIDPCVGCGYKDANCIKNIMRDALSLIRQQQERIKELEAGNEARILSFDEALEADVCWLEARGVDRVIPCRIECTPGSVTVLIRKMIALPESMMREDYLIEWRPWSSRPTFEQREAVMWK